jgi:hypothetical protein
MTFTGRVAPFGDRWITVRLLTPHRFSQASTSFFAGYRLGIHHVHLLTCPYNAALQNLSLNPRYSASREYV